MGIAMGQRAAYRGHVTDPHVGQRQQGFGDQRGVGTNVCGMFKIRERRHCADRQAAGVYRALHELDMTVPGDISVIGFDNLPYTEIMNPPLTTVHAPRMELGRTAATMLLRLINGEALDMTRVVLPTEFIERQSCRPLSLETEAK